jgi:tetratricopeptide (TPR) repeat protein
LESFLKAYTFAANDNERSESSQLIASAYKALNDMDRAIEYQLKSTILEKRSGEVENYVNAVLELAELRIANKELVAAEKNVKEVASITSNANSDYWSARTFYAVAKLEYAKGNVDAYRRARDEARLYAGKSGNKALQGRVESLKE